MTYKILAYGDYDVEKDVNGITNIEEAERIMDKMVTRWCKKHNVDPKEVYCEGEHYFQYGKEDYGVAIYALYEVPDFTNEVDELLWKAKLEMNKAEFEAENYSWNLSGCNVAYYTGQAIKILNEIKQLIKED